MKVLDSKSDFLQSCKHASKTFQLVSIEVLNIAGQKMCYRFIKRVSDKGLANLICYPTSIPIGMLHYSYKKRNIHKVLFISQKV